MAYIGQLKIFRKVPKIRMRENVKGVPFFNMADLGEREGYFVIIEQWFFIFG